MATDATGDISWKAVQEAFGAVSVQQHQSRISMNLRFPGQYYDQETGTHYNFHRDYKPNAGRYAQSDSIGLNGGVNTYSYVDASPIAQLDPEGLVRWQAESLGAARGLFVVFTMGLDVMRFSSVCQNGNPCIVYTVVGVGGVGVGLPVAVTMDLRGTTYVDGFDEPSPSSIGGVAVKVGCQAVLGRNLGSAMLTVVGNTVNESKLSGPSLAPVGLDFSCQATVGVSLVFSSDCNCGDFL